MMEFYYIGVDVGIVSVCVVLIIYDGRIVLFVMKLL